MTLKSNLLPTVDKLRKIPGKLGFRPYSVELIRRTGGDWANGVSPTTEVITTLTVADGYAPKVRWVEQSDYARGTPLDVVLEITVTPDYLTGGYTYEDLEDTDAPDNSQIFYRVKGPGFPADGGWFQKVQFSGDRNLAFTIQLKRAADGNQTL